MPALGVAILSGGFLKVAWWLRGTLAASVCGGIVLVFLARTEQFDLVLLLVLSAAGFVLGVAAPGKHSRGVPNTPLPDPAGAPGS